MCPIVLKQCAASLFAPATTLFTKCVKSSCLPKQWKIHKTTRRVINQIIIGLFRCFAFCQDAGVHHLRKNNPFPATADFRYTICNRSCLTNLLSTHYLINKRKKSCNLVFLDFQNAFDSVAHNELLYKLW